MAIDDSLRLVIKPNSKRDRSLLPDMIDQLEALTRLLKALSDRDTTTFEVVSLSTNSPLTAELRAVDKTRYTTRKTVGKSSVTHTRYRALTKPSTRIVQTLDALSEDAQLPSYVDAYVLLQAREFADQLVKANSTASVSYAGKTYQVDERLKRLIDSRLGAKRLAYASFTGILERLNVHGSKWSFTIFPVAGPSRILCRFDKDDLDAIKGLVKQTVTVKGLGVYASKSPWPIQLRVESIRAKLPAPDNAWINLPNRMRNDWENASATEKALLDLEALGA